MDFELYIAFIGASLILGLIPGPNVALIVATSLTHGTRGGLYAVAGSSSAMVPQLVLVTLGFSAVMVFMSEWFDVLRWAGVLYLLYLGFRYWRDVPAPLDARAPAARPCLKTLFTQGFLTSATNPKTLMFFGAFLPQFVAPEGSVLGQMALLSVTFIVTVSIVDSGWALLAGAARPLLKKISSIRNKISAGFFLLCGLGLALAKRP